MHGRNKLRELRAAISEAIFNETRDSQGGKTSNELILSRFQRDCPGLIDEFRSTLLMIGLTKILNDECQKVPRELNSVGQPGLFTEAEQMTFILSLGNGKKQNALDMPLNQIVEHLTKRSPTKKTAKDRFLEWLKGLESYSETGAESPRELIAKAKKASSDDE